MKKFLIGYKKWLVLSMAAAVLLAWGGKPAAAAPSAFEVLRRQMPAKLDLLRERVNEAGGQDLRLALLLSAQNEDAHTVATTVLVYQQYPRERQLAVLLAAAVKYHQQVGLMQQVEDRSLKQALAQAPQEMDGIEGMFQTVQNMLNMTPQELKSAVEVAQKLNMQRKSAEAVKRTVKHQFRKQNPDQNKD